MSPAHSVLRRGNADDAGADPTAAQNLRLNTVALILSTASTGVLGLAFWAVAARLFPPDQVGVASALITSAVLLSTMSTLGIDVLYERFLPVAGWRAPRLLRRGFVLVAAMGVLTGAALVAFGPRDPLFQTPSAMVGFPLMVLVLAMFALLDKASAGLGVARWAAVKNLVHAVAKLAAVAALAIWDHAATIVLSWTLTAGVAALCTYVVLDRRSRTQPRWHREPDLPPRRQMWSYFGSSFGIASLWSIGPLVVPLIVVTQVGEAANAYFAVAWAMISALYLMLHLVVSPYVAEVAAHPEQIGALSWRMVRTLAAVAIAASAGLVLVGPLMLSIAGPEYRAEAHGLLWLAAAFLPLSGVAAIYEGFSRVRRKLGLYLSVQALMTVVIIAGSWFATRSMGIVGVGWAYLAAETLAAVILIGPCITWLRRAGSDDGHDGDDRPGGRNGRAWLRAGTLLVVTIVPITLLGTIDRPTASAAVVMFDDFNGPAGSRPDPARWGYDLGGGGWGNGEAQTYTDSPENAALDGDGHLVITARRDGDGFTSARMTTQGKLSFVHGRAEARLRLPRGAGLHPAFWLLGDDVDHVGWPRSGELDVVETISGAEFIHNGAIGPDSDGKEYKLASTDPIQPSFVDDFHTYWVQRDPGVITMGVDDRTTAVFREADLPPDEKWVFDKPFYLLLNVAVGGSWPGPADASTPSPAAMTVDWVRVTSD
ncbi:family 16 glycosylhydrolase [Mycolicibacterium obuense]|uniref:family 16 glycosylhydrolase n=1 Tax=Mycolicibacterium obuense TaxID=1807 RepID=UPI001EEF26A1|nr:family 16 glycosylhydrolase [Mycolicibacterium obuense]